MREIEIKYSVDSLQRVEVLFKGGTRLPCLGSFLTGEGLLDR